MSILSIHRLFRWHLWMGVLISPLLLLMAVTGCTLIFRHEILEYWQRDVRCVVPGQATMPLSRQLDSLRRAHPDWTPTTVTISSRSDRSTLVQVTKPIPIVGSVPFVGIDPYSAQVLGEAEANLDFFDWILTIHKTMRLGPDGRILVELVTSWAIVTVLSGTFLWLAHRRRPSKAVANRRHSVRSLLRSWHTNGGLLLSFPILVILASGLFFTTIWSALANYATGARLAFPSELLASPISESSISRLSQQQDLVDAALPVRAGNEILLDGIVETSKSQFPGKALRLSLPLLPGESYRVHAMSDDGTRIFGLICLSTLDGSVLHLAPENQWSLPQSIRLAALSVHTGSLWGLLTKSVAILACSMLLVLSVTGPWMLWMRGPLRDSSRANSPDSPDDRRSWLMTGAIVFFAILLPTVGISILIFLSIQWALDHLRGS